MEVDAHNVVPVWVASDKREVRVCPGHVPDKHACPATCCAAALSNCFECCSTTASILTPEHRTSLIIADRRADDSPKGPQELARVPT